MKPFIILIVAIVATIFFLRVGALIPAGFISLLIVFYPLIDKIVSHSLYKNKSNSSLNLTRKEALEILGLREGSTAEEIKEAYNNMIKRNHPDQGGSEYLAAKINEAKRVLLGK